MTLLIRSIATAVYKRLSSTLVTNSNMAQKKTTHNENSIVWIDMEMTGLNVKEHRIMEIACVITDPNLNIVAKSPLLIINQSEEVLSNMNEWCVKQHGITGLTKDCRESSVTEEQAENILLQFLKENVPEGKCPLAGNTIYMDRLFLMEYMPKANDYLHYRLIDVSTIKELCRRWKTDVYRKAPVKKLNHRALDDILESIDELKHYKLSLFSDC